jgi:hypothetical protein
LNAYLLIFNLSEKNKWRQHSISTGMIPTGRVHHNMVTVAGKSEFWLIGGQNSNEFASIFSFDARIYHFVILRLQFHSLCFFFFESTSLVTSLPPSLFLTHSLTSSSLLLETNEWSLIDVIFELPLQFHTSFFMVNKQNFDKDLIEKNNS